MSQVDFWLYPLIALAVVSLISRMTLPIKWSWGFILQVLPVLLISSAGLYFEPKWIYAVVGWILAIVIFLPSKLFYSYMQKYLTGLNADGMRVLSRRVKWFFWGLAGQFWSDMAQALAYYIEQNASDAEELILKWKDREGLPKQVKKLPDNYRKIGNAIMWRWPEIIDEFERVEENDRAKLGNSVLLSTARAYAELGRFKDAAKCIELSKMGDTIIPLNFLALSVLPFFSLTGAIDKVEKLFEILKKSKGDFAQSSRYYWLGRCYRAQGKVEKAKEAFEKSYELAKSKQFRVRLDEQKACLEKEEEELNCDQLNGYVLKVWNIFKKAAYVQELLSPQRRSITVNAIVVLIVIVFMMTDCYRIVQLFPSLESFGYSAEQLILFRKIIFGYFAVLPAEYMTYDQYYRLLSYLFLHAHETHMIFNVIALLWFGRIAENIFGTSRFFAIYMVGGILSGVSHALMSTLPAVGASGAVMAVFSASGVGIFRLKNKIPEPIWKFKLGMLSGLALFQIILDQLIPHVAVFAHLGGLLAGAAFGMVLSIRSPKSDQQEITGQYVSG